MTVLRALFLVSDLAPLTGTSPQAKEHNYLSRAIAELGSDVIVAIPGERVEDSARATLARRLSPLCLACGEGSDDTVELTVSEGSAASGRVELVVIDIPDEIPAERARALFYEAALHIASENGRGVDVVLSGHGTEDALDAVAAVADARGSGESEEGERDDAGQREPVRVFLLRDLEAAAAESALVRADRVVVSSASLAATLVRQIDNGGRDRASRQLAPFRDKLYGVPAGIDTVEWNPHQDGHLDRDFTLAPRAGKVAHKQRLRDQLHLRASNPGIPLLAVIGPIDENVLTYGVANRLVQMPLQLAVVADRDADAASLRYFDRIANQSPDRIAVRTFDDATRRGAFVHELVAGADFFLIPRDSSPPAVSDLYGLAYGCAPIAPNVGGYADTLVEFDSLSGTGSGFLYRPYDEEHLLDAVQRALNAYRRGDDYSHLLERIMDLDLSWRATAQRYVNIIVDVIQERRTPASALAI